MITLFFVLIALAATIVAFFSLLWAWLLIIVPSALITLYYALVLKQAKWKPVAELSPDANAMFQAYGHYYTCPLVSRGISAGVSALQLASPVVAVIGIFKGSWWGVGISVGVWMGMSSVAMGYNPTNFLRTPEQLAAHEEVTAHILRKEREIFDRRSDRWR